MRLRWAFTAVVVLALALLWWWRDAAEMPAPRVERPEPRPSHRRLGPRPEAPAETSAPQRGVERVGAPEAPTDAFEDELSAFFWAACEIDGAEGVSEAILFPEGLQTRQGMQPAGPVHIRDGHLWLPRSLRSGSGVVAIEGFAPTHIRWDAERGACSPSPIALAPPTATLSGVVRNAEGRRAGRVFVEGCGGRAMTDADGFYAMEPLPGDCALTAFRQDGYFMARSEPARLRVREGDDLIVDLRLPEVARGGVGMRVREHEEGVAVDGVVPGSPAELAGLGAGDLVLAVDGQPAVDLSLEDFVDQVTGDAGTPVELVVLTAAGEERVLTLTRTPLGPQD